MKSLIYCALLIVIVSGAVAYNPDDHDSSSPTTSTNPVRAENMTVTASTPVEAGNSSSIKTGDAGNSSGIEPTPSDSDDSTESTWTWNCTDDKLRNRLKESLRPNETLNSLFSDVFIDTEWRLRNRRVPSSELLHVQLCVGNLPELCHHSMPKEFFFRNLSVMLFSYRKLLEGRPRDANGTDALPNKSLFAAIKKKIDRVTLMLREMRMSCFDSKMQRNLLQTERDSAKPSRVLNSLYAYLGNMNVSESEDNNQSYCKEPIKHRVENKEAIVDPLTIDHILYYKAMESLLHVWEYCPVVSILSATQIAN
ncbi:uncharacterized protein [Oscarella lobularis]|uniref:uncharacterized protein n=1 Tax=Oscarella lobularis TaxID=121494 RepID=UPI0033137057